MLSPTLRRFAVSLGLLFAAGCLYPVDHQIDQTVCDLAGQPRDPLPPGTRNEPRPPPEQPPAQGVERFTIPPNLLPGGTGAPIDLPPLNPENEAKRKEAIGNLFPDLAPLGEDPETVEGPEGRPLTLGDLQQLGLANSPAIKQATAAVEAARGAATQAGLYPNPTIGYQQDTANTTGGPGYVGFSLDQKIIVTNKLQLARAAAAMDLRNAEVALRRAQTDLASKIRSGYFAVLVARENVKVSKALVRFTTGVYGVHVDQVAKGGIAAAYEPMQLRALAFQARGALVLARNRYTSAWKQLASIMGVPGLPRTELAGTIDMRAPVLEYQEILTRVLQCHTDLATAGNSVLKARYNLQLARVTPLPDPDVRTVLQKDYTGPPNNIAYSLAIGIAIALWDGNQGNIHQAQATLVQTTEEASRVRVELTTRLADAFERYQNNRTLLGYYRDHILPDQVRVYQAIRKRWNGEAGGVGFADIVVAQQNLAGSVAIYVTTLGQYWQAVVDVVDLLQTNDLFSTGQVETPTECVGAGLDLEQLLAPPCRPACAPQPGPAQPSSAQWPEAIAEGTNQPAPLPEQGPQPTPLKKTEEEPASQSKGPDLDPVKPISPALNSETRREEARPSSPREVGPRLLEPSPEIGTK